MTTIHFTARLLADAVLSERGATTGGHRCLDYIPGATLLGAVADKIYKKNYAPAFNVFHSGKVRFGNAYPLTDEGEPTLPIPLCWHAAKGEELNNVKGIKNLIHANKSRFDEWNRKGEQQKQLRGGYFTPKGEKIDPSRNYRLKTAINRNKQGTADDAQLFGYQSLASGSSWYFSVSCDEDVPEGVVDEMAKALAGTIRVGRSRSAEYGLLAVTKSELSMPQPLLKPCSQLLFYCASDLALADQVTGAPVLVPTAKQFGLNDADFKEQKSYLRIRSYAPFNSTRRRFDLERQVVAKGSVLVFEKEEGEFTIAELSVLQRRLESGIGLYRQDGLGQILVNPPFLADFEFKEFDTPTFSLKLPPTSSKPPALAGWLKEKADERSTELATIKEVDGWINDLVNGPCPKNSQWGQLRIIAVQEKTLVGITAKATKLCSEGVSQKQWSKNVKITNIKTSYGKFLFETVLNAPLDLVRKRLYLLGNRLPRKNNKQNGGDE